MTLRALLDRIPPLRTPERVGGLLSILAAVILLWVVAPDLQGRASPGPTGSPQASLAASLTPEISASPAASIPSADLRAVDTLERRLLGLADSIRRELDAESPSVGTLVALLRQVNATVVAGSGAIDALASSPATAALAADLAAAHADIGDAVTSTLTLGLSQTAAYIDGGRRVATLVEATAPLALQVEQLLTGALPSASPLPSVAPSPSKIPSPSASPSATAIPSAAASP
jgi:hypothetical protein